MAANTYDIIISGSGIAGLSLLYRAMKADLWVEKRIAVVDNNLKQQNDKTISFWKKKPTAFDHIIHSSWTEISFYSNAGEKIKLDAGPYTYHSIRSIDFYHECLTYLKQFPNITFLQADIRSVGSDEAQCIMETDKGRLTSRYLFNSIYKTPELRAGDQYFLQHFKGLKIKIDKPVVPVNEAYLMDYRSSQEHGTTFFYTLPLAENELFVEYTIFSKTLLQPHQYDEKISRYLHEVLNIDAYEILEEEFGVIPMTNHQFVRKNGNVMNIGSIGGDTRASTGYTFMNVQKVIDQILRTYKTKGHPFFADEPIGIKESLYDSTLLNVLDSKSYEGHQLFTDLFQGTKAKYVFAFLDAESNILNDLRIMKSLRTFPFLKAFLKSLARR